MTAPASGHPADRLIMALDCATSHLAIAISSEDGTVLAALAEDVGREHAARFVTAMSTVTAGLPGWRERLRAVVAGEGPGSYTGVRVALAAAAGLARATGAELRGAPSFAALAAGTLTVGEEAVVVLDARRGNVYAAVCALDEAEPGKAPVVRVLEGPVKVARERAGGLAAGKRVVEAGSPVAAALVPAARAGAPVALYL